jgi:hypothetical protein
MFDDAMDLGEGYWYLPEYEAIDIGYPDGKSVIYKSQQKNAFTEVLIEGEILTVSTDENYIFAVLEGPKFYIIDKKETKIYGPYNDSTNISK